MRSFSGASYRTTCAFYTSWMSKTSSSTSDSLTETEGDYSFADAGSKFFFRCANVSYFLRLQFQQIPNLSSPFLRFLIHFTVRIKLNPVLLKHLIPRPLQGENRFSKECLVIIQKDDTRLFYKNEGVLLGFFSFFWSLATNCLRGLGSEIPNSVYCFSH